MKKLTAIILAVIMAFSVLSMCGFAAEEPAIRNVSVMQADLIAEDDTDREVNWYESNGEYYLFIPSSVSYLLADFVVDSSEKVYIDGVEYAQKQKLALAIGDKKQVTLKAGNEEYKLNIIDGSKIASVFITTESGSLDYIHQDKSNKEEGFIEIVDAMGIAVYDGVLDQIKGRGNSTWGNPKKPYNIKLDEKANLFGMGKSKKWSLLANYGDESLIRNSAVLSVGDKVGVPYTPKGVSCDVYINGNYEGVYLLTTRVEVDKTRVDIDNLDDVNEEICQEFYDDEDFDMDTLKRGGKYGQFAGLLEGTMKWVDIPVPADSSATAETGGYIIEMELANRYADEISGFVTTRSQPFTMKSPEYASKAQMGYISDYYQRFEDAVFSETGKNANGEDYKDLADFDSLVSYYVVSEWAGNMDSGLTSTYFFKPANDKLYAGPLWDYDIALGNNGLNRFGVDYTNPNEFTVARNRMYRNTVFGKYDAYKLPTIYNQLCQKKEFVDAAKAVWDSKVKDAVALVNAEMTLLGEILVDSAVMNAIRWNSYGTSDASAIATAYKADVKKALDYSSAKSTFLTANLGTIVEQDLDNGFFNVFLYSLNNIFENIVKIFS